MHEPSRIIELRKSQDWIRRKLPDYLQFFANGSEIDPLHVMPRLIEVSETWQNDLFRLGRFTWSLPFSKGYGRRMRFLIMDSHHNKLIGILALQSPPLSFPARDDLFEYPPERKTELVNQTMDIQTLGSLQPYSRLLGGKLVALAASSNEVRSAYRQKYEGRTTEMEARRLPAHLVALSTTSAFGRSSIYNRLRYHDLEIARSIGYTKGYGSFHLMGLYPEFRDFLEVQGISTRGGFGTGPRRKWQTMVRALELLGFSKKLLRHGIAREAFLFPLTENLEDYIEGRATEPIYHDLSFSNLSSYWRERWLIPRADRMDDWRTWSKETIAQRLLLPDETQDGDE